MPAKKATSTQREDDLAKRAQQHGLRLEPGPAPGWRLVDAERGTLVAADWSIVAGGLDLDAVEAVIDQYEAAAAPE